MGITGTRQARITGTPLIKHCHTLTLIGFTDVLDAIRAASVQKLVQHYVADPPFGVGHTTTGSYLQVSGIPGLTAVDIALRNLIISERAAIRANFRKYNHPLLE